MIIHIPFYWHTQLKKTQFFNLGAGRFVTWSFRTRSFRIYIGTFRKGVKMYTQIEKLCFFQLCVSVKGDIYYHTSYFLTLRCIITLVKGVSTWYCNFNKYKYNFRYSNTAHIPTVKTTRYVIDIMLQKLGMSCQTTIGKKHFPINLRV
jgi:hypothetical protein